MSETIMLHGGPMHEQIREVQFSGDPNIIYVMATNPDIKHKPGLTLRDALDMPPAKRAAYTRVHTRNGKPTQDFEWAGYR